MDKKKLRPALFAAAVFVVTIVIFVLLLFAAALIPKEAIRENTLTSARYCCETDVYYDHIEGIAGSRIDRYADSILLNIAWSYDRDDVARSVMRSAYYYDKGYRENENFLKAVLQDLPPTRQYLRYWHGSLAIVRPLLVLFDIQKIYIINAVLMIALIIALIVMLLRRGGTFPVIGLVAGLVMVDAWYVTTSLEYMWTFLLMPLFSAIALKSDEKEGGHTGIAFMLFGMVTAYLDFLTTETITLLVPLLILLWNRRRRGGKEGFVRSAACLAISWGLGYALCWAGKWLLAAAFLQENVWPYVGDDIAHRLGGNEFIHLTLSEYLLSALGRNICTLFPLEYGAVGVTVFVTLIVMYAYILYVYRGKGADSRLLLVYLCIAAVPYVRYMVLHNHSYLHYFFTHRAQLGTVLALVLILCEAGVGRTMASHVSTLRRKGRR